MATRNPDELLMQHHEPRLQVLLKQAPSPGQINLADDPAYTDKRAELEHLLLEQQEALGDPYGI